jgi:hypothetical protein
MKLFFLFICALFLSSDSSINCFKPADFCKKESTVQKCKAYDCGAKFCSIKKQSCVDLISWGNLVKKYYKEPKKYKRFMFDIKICVKIKLKNH